MQIIIFEGIPTSGKTSTIKATTKQLDSNDYVIIYEDQTLMSMLENKDEEIAITHLESFKSQIEELSLTKKLLIIDRFHYTHIFRTKSNFEVFEELENWLQNYKTIVVILKISFEDIMSRIDQSLTHRDQSWTDYVNSKGNSTQIRDYYFDQQKQLFEISCGSRLDNYTINTDSQNWDEYASRIKLLLNE
jgi:thymidylate kinase